MTSPHLNTGRHVAPVAVRAAALLLACFLLLAAGFLAHPDTAFAGPARTLYVINDTDATISIFRRGNVHSEQVIPPRTEKSLFNYLGKRETIIQVTAPCLNNAPGLSYSFWVTGQEQARNVLRVTSSNFGKSVMFDRPNCQEGTGSAVEDACVDYANTAVQQYRAAKRNACGFSGARWTADFNGHLQWCKAAGVGPASREESARADMLQQCASKDCSRCKNYEEWLQKHADACNYHGRRLPSICENDPECVQWNRECGRVLSYLKDCANHCR